MQVKTILITGATSGIGMATAKLLAKNNFRMIICGRRVERLKELEVELKELTDVITLDFDVRDKDSVNSKINSLPESFKTIDILINNAGNAHGLDPIQEGEIDDWDSMIDINIKGLLYVSKAIIPGMIKRKQGHIVNIGSVAGIDVYPKGNVYCASKSAVDAISKGMRIDLIEYGIKVSEIKPGAVETEFSKIRFKGDEAKAAKVYEGFDPLTAEDIAEIIHFMISRPPHVNIADTLVLSAAQANGFTVHRNQ